MALPDLSFLVVPTLLFCVPLFFFDRSFLGVRRYGWLALLALDAYFHFVDRSASWTQHVALPLLGAIWLPHAQQALAHKPLWLGYGALAAFALALVVDPPRPDLGVAAFLAWPDHGGSNFGFAHGLAHLAVFGMPMLNNIVLDRPLNDNKGKRA